MPAQHKINLRGVELQLAERVGVDERARREMGGNVHGQQPSHSIRRVELRRREVTVTRE